MKNEKIKEITSKAIEQLIAALNKGRNQTLMAYLRASRWSIPRTSLRQWARSSAKQGKPKTKLQGGLEV